MAHREPMLMLDAVTETEFRVSAKGYKNIFDDEFWCKGHFPSEAIFPGVLIVEVLAQLCTFIYYIDNQNEPPIKPYLAKIDEMKFLEKVHPNSQLFAEAILLYEGAGFAQMKCIAICNNKKVAKGKITCFLEVNR